MRFFVKFAAIAATVVMATACGGNKKPVYHNLLGKKWMLESVTTETGVHAAPANVYLKFSDSLYVFGRAGCNSFIGNFKVEKKGEISIETGPMTMMFCENMDFENMYVGLLKNAGRYVAEEQTLTLTDGAGAFTLLYTPHEL